MGGSPPGVDVESRGQTYRNESGSIYHAKLSTKLFKGSLVQEKTQYYQNENLSKTAIIVENESLLRESKKCLL